MLSWVSPFKYAYMRGGEYRESFAHGVVPLPQPIRPAPPAEKRHVKRLIP